MSDKKQSTGPGSYSKDTMTKADASRIQAAQAKAGNDTGSDTFAARAQSAGDQNANNAAQGAAGGEKK